MYKKNNTGSLKWIHDNTPKLWIDPNNHEKVYSNGVVYLDNSKEIVFCNKYLHNKKSPLFSYKYKDSQFTNPSYYNTLPSNPINYKSLTKCHDFILTTCYTQDFNIIYWNKHNEYTKVLNLYDCSGDCSTSSNCIYQKLYNIVKYNLSCSCHLDKKYVKVQGFTCIESSNLMIFGLTHYSNCLHNKNNKTFIIKCSYKVEDDKISLNNDFKYIMDIDFNMYNYNIPKNITKELELVDIAYDSHNEKLLILTSYEKYGYGGYLWYINWYSKLEEFSCYLNIATKCHFNYIPTAISHIHCNKVIITSNKIQKCECCPIKSFNYQICEYN